MPFVEIDHVNRKLHSDCMYALRGRYPKTFTRSESLGLLSEQALHSSPGSIRQLDLRRQDGLLTPIQKLILQRRPQLSAYLSFATFATHHNDHNEDHSYYTQDNAKSSLVHLGSPFLLIPEAWKEFLHYRNNCRAQYYHKNRRHDEEN